ncbi:MULTISPECIES: 5'-deoxynucleotidase [unclassified Shewanella]|uniref:5'-deoxynucleotidase n=1 Tax=unclassified Shewanella TaxID=196818 RepID=UPI000C8165AD|nr:MULTISPECIES: 5'-deoxynucleotidase [unclassified Shewanella]MDO6618364.1 5'-deoxynucleotidase [Shewanella sp. 6_MG-2023]MDO6776433.1 5'-deoxynucleotidase [Shewanella sp. 3_MG-2023]PMG28372.1 5'-deoxynucleotidase [Shewanella sp. 10N.286.52.C2]PMG47382.1 5'-deoxynucleotidase [Shewanella sp. 10N.286.52.B9]PMH89373.1 5'-deoxynucleotidase [Shewanella sp. 10N.286.48.B5]
MKPSTFMAWITRMPLLERWALMHCFQKENVSEHCHQVAVIAHLLVVIKNKRFGGKLNPEKAATIALYHEVSETKLQDINSNTKYHSPEFTKAFKKLEDLAEKECLASLPEDLREEMEPLLVQTQVDPEYKAIVKAADILQAYVKTMNELRFNNDEFQHVKINLDKKLKQMEQDLPEVKCFIEIFLDSCTSTLDKLTENELTN